MRRLLTTTAVCLIAALILLPGCGGGAPEQSSGALKVGMVFDVGGKGDKSFNDSAYRGLLRAADDFGVEHTEFEPGQDADRETGLRKLAQAGYDVIIGVGFLFSESVRTVAADFPDVRFACVDFDVRPGETLPSNLAGLRFREEEGSFLVGAMAAMTSETGRIGFVGGMDVLPRLQRRKPDPSVDPELLPKPDKILEAKVLRKRDHEYVPKKAGDGD